MLKQFSLRMYKLAIALCCTMFLITSCSDDDDTIRVASVDLDEVEVLLVTGQVKKLTPTITPQDAAVKDVTWKSSDESIAMVTETGEVMALAPGYVVVTVTTVDGGKTDRCLFTVEKATIPVVSVILNKTDLTLFVDKKETLRAIITPEDASNQSVIWNSSNEAVATVSDSGEVTTIAVGTATITATTLDGHKTATCNVTVVPPTEYTVTFNSNGGTAVDDVKVVEGDRLMKPEDPVMTGSNAAEGLYAGIINVEIGANFDGWFTDEELTNAYNFNAPVTGDLTLYAKWDGTAPEPLDISGTAGNNILEKTFKYLADVTLSGTTSYTLVLANDFTANSGLSEFTNANVILTIVGKEQERVIQKTNVGNIFTLRAGTVILGNNIKVTGTLGKFRPFFLTGEGKLVMEKGSKISDVTGTGNCGAVYMDSGLTTFTMNGGEICNNVIEATESDFVFMGAAICAFRGGVTINGGLISNNKIRTNRGTYEIAGGIYLTNGWNTVINKTGGIIKDNTAENFGTGTGKLGQQVFWSGGDKGIKKIDTNLGEADSVSSNSNTTIGEAWQDVE